MKTFLLICMQLVTNLAICQIGVEWGSPVKWTYVYDGAKTIIYGIDTITFDTLRFTKTHFYRVSNTGKILAELEFDMNAYYCSDDGYHLTGKWTKRYPSGMVAEEGNYACNFKIDEWVYYYENGNIQKYENYFRTKFQEYVEVCGRLNGLYKEYYENGKTKISGSYKIIEEYTTIAIFNPDTYEDEEKCCEWALRSVKEGVWTKYNEKGKRTSRKVYHVGLEGNKNLRDISDKLHYSKETEND